MYRQERETLRCTLKSRNSVRFSLFLTPPPPLSLSLSYIVSDEKNSSFAAPALVLGSSLVISVFSHPCTCVFFVLFFFSFPFGLSGCCCCFLCYNTLRSRDHHLTYNWLSLDSDHSALLSHEKQASGAQVTQAELKVAVRVVERLQELTYTHARGSRSTGTVKRVYVR